MEMNLQKLAELLRSDSVKNIILDTDTYNEVDDQFCLAYCMRSPDRVRLLSVNAAPFLNSRSTSPADGMEKSYQEIFKVMKLVDPDAKIPVYRGSDRFLENKQTPVESPAADNIIRTVTESWEPVLIVAIGAITNVASALIKRPELAKETAVIWLGGCALHAQSATEFNMMQDIAAAQIVFDSGIPLVQIPCEGVCTEMVTTVPELDHYLTGKNALCDYLVDNVRVECENIYAGSRIIWDITAAATLICPKGCQMVEIPRPVITEDSDHPHVCYYAKNDARPHYLYVCKLWRDVIYGDLFRRLVGKEGN